MAFVVDDIARLGSTIADIAARFIPDPKAKQDFEQSVMNALLGYDQGQMRVNEKEAESNDLFVAGWRPFIGWVCGVALAYQYIAMPILMWVSINFMEKPFMAPPIKLDDMLWQLLLGMLGMGGLRTWEKYKGLAK